MTPDRLPAIRERVRERLRGNADVLYRHEGTFTKAQNGQTRTYPCRFSVKDPVKADPKTIAQAQAFAGSQGASFVDTRLLKVHLDDKRPPEGSVLSTPWDGGTLTLVRWSQSSDFTDQSVGLCLLRR